MSPRIPLCSLALLPAGLALAIAAAGCGGRDFSEPQLLGGEHVPAEVLNRGALDYRRYCIGCHGPRGDGQGASAVRMQPPPRDFTRGSFKWSAVPEGGLPRDEDLLRTLRHGLRGTHMPAFGSLPDEDARALVQYLKTFSPRWRQERPGQPVPLPPDPWARGQRREAIARGDLVYHAVAQCWSCHPAYRGREKILAMMRELRPPLKPVPFRSGLEGSRPVAGVHGRLTPPDFLKDTLRASRDDGELYRTIAAGVGGTPMPSWYRELSPRDLWAVAHYVGELVRIQGTPEAEALRAAR